MPEQNVIVITSNTYKDPNDFDIVIISNTNKDTNHLLKSQYELVEIKDLQNGRYEHCYKMTSKHRDYLFEMSKKQCIKALMNSLTYFFYIKEMEQKRDCLRRQAITERNNRRMLKNRIRKAKYILKYKSI